jgi:hypothetical protein
VQCAYGAFVDEFLVCENGHAIRRKSISANVLLDDRL